MKPARRRQPARAGLARRVGVGVVLVVAGILGLRFLLADDGYSALLSLRGELDSLQAEVDDLDLTNQQLQQAILALQGESFAVEKIAREDLDLVAPGEILYLFPAALAPDPATESGRAMEHP